MVRYHHKQKKTNDPILRKLSDGQKNGQTGESNFIGRCPTKVERPISTLVKYKITVLFWVILSTWIQLFIVLVSDKPNVVNIITCTVHKGWAKNLNFFFFFWNNSKICYQIKLRFSGSEVSSIQKLFSKLFWK